MADVLTGVVLGFMSLLGTMGPRPDPPPYPKEGCTDCGPVGYLLVVLIGGAILGLMMLAWHRAADDRGELKPRHRRRSRRRYDDD